MNLFGYIIDFHSLFVCLPAIIGGSILYAFVFWVLPEIIRNADGDLPNALPVASQAIWEETVE